MPVAILDEGSGRADRLFRAAAPDLPRTLMKSLFADGLVRANGRRVKAGALLEAPVRFEWPDAEAGSIPDAGSWSGIAVLDDSGSWFAVNKPAGLHTARLKGRGGVSLEDWLEEHEPGLAAVEEHGLVNRLDRETSGVVLCARDSRMRDRLREEIAGAEKTYWAAVTGEPPDSGTVDFELRSASRSSGTVSRYGRRAQRTGSTSYHVTGRKPGYALLEVDLEGPGARHQIRAHLGGEGFPIAGDPLYGGAKAGGPPRLALHAWKLKLPGWAKPVVAPVPADLLAWWNG